MDKYEYKIRSDEIKKLISDGRYAEAVKLADTIDWKRVGSVSTLCMISDLYKINRRFEESKDILLMAYERNPSGRAIVYSLCELAIKMGEFVQAVEYYKEFVRIAPRDNKKYILQYRLYEAQDVSLEERIAVLQELKKHDFQEKWGYELAYLYHRVGFVTDCVEACDEMFLWFGEGRYVMKALELKALHTPLSPEQQDRYNRYKGMTGVVSNFAAPQGWSVSAQPTQATVPMQIPSQTQTIPVQPAVVQVNQPVMPQAVPVYVPSSPAVGPVQQPVAAQTVAVPVTPQTPVELAYSYSPEVVMPVPVPAENDFDPGSFDIDIPVVQTTDPAKVAMPVTDTGRIMEMSSDAARALIQSVIKPQSDVTADTQRMPDPYGMPVDPMSEPTRELPFIGEVKADEVPGEEQMTVSAPAETPEGMQTVLPEMIATADPVSDIEEEEAALISAAEAPSDPDDYFSAEAGFLVPTADVSNFNTINLQKEIAQGLREVMEEEYTTPDEEEQSEPVSREVFFEESGEASAPVPAQENYVPFTPQESAIEEEPPVVVTPQMPKASIAEELRDKKVAARVAESTVDQNPLYKGTVYTDEPLQEEVPGAVIRPNLRYQGSHFDRILTQEVDGQFSMALSEKPRLERQITGQISISDYMLEWEQVKKRQQEKQLEIIKTRFLEDTGDMLAEYDEETKRELELQQYGKTVDKVESSDGDVAEFEVEDILGTEIDETTDEIEITETSAMEEAEETGAAEEEETAADIEKADVADAAEESEKDEADKETATSDTTEEETSAVRFDTSELESEVIEAELARKEAEEAAGQIKTEPGEEVFEQSAQALETVTDFKKSEIITSGEEGDAHKEETAGEAEAAVEEKAEAVSGEASVKEEEESSAAEQDIAAAEKKESVKEDPAAEKAGKEAARSKKALKEGSARPMTPEEKEIFGPYIHQKDAREQIVRAIDSISMAAYTDNIIITGEQGAGTVPLAKGLIRAAEQADSNFSGKVAKITAAAMNRKSVAPILDKLEGGALIIQQAGDLKEETASSLLKLLENENKGIIIVLEDTRKEIENLITRQPGMLNCFNVRVDIEALDDESLVAFARQYALENEYSIDNLGVLALHTRIAERQTSNHEVTVSEVKDIVDGAIKYANKHTVGHFFDVLFGKRYDKEDMIILRERDFMSI